MDPFTWIILAVVAIAMTVVSFAMMPKPKTTKPEAAQDMDNPTAEAGRPIPVVFGTKTIKGGNVLWWGEKSKREHELDA